MTSRFALVSVTALFVFSGPISAQDLVFQPVNPSFGGNALNSSHLLSVANAQKNATARDVVTSSSGSSSFSSSSSSSLSQAELFARQLQSRLLSALSSEVVDAIFGDDPQQSGEVVFGTTTISFERGVDAIDLVLTDTVEGTVTEISVPQLVVN